MLMTDAYLGFKLKKKSLLLVITCELCEISFHWRCWWPTHIEYDIKIESLFAELKKNVKQN